MKESCISSGEKEGRGILLYYTLRLIDGLCDDIKSIVFVQRPQDLDTACVLAALQEEVGDSFRRREFRRPDPPFSS